MSYQLLPRDASSPIPQPITTGSSGPPSRRRSLLTFVGIAAASGIIFHIIFTFGFAPGSPPNHPDSLGPSNIKDWWSNTGDASYDSKGPAGTTGHGGPASCPPPSTLDEDGLGGSTSYIRPGLGQYVEEGEDEWTMDKIRTMVEGTKGYYVRDWSLGLGWNNMRYIIETSLLHANLLNRTLVLPSFVYARACEWNITVCASFAEMVNRGDAIGWGEWRELPIEEQMGWKIPIDVMLDLRRMRKYSPTVTVAEYLTLQELSPSLEGSNGAWNREVYHSGPQHPTLGTIPNHEYDPKGIVRVDKLPPYASGSTVEGPVTEKLMQLKGDDLVLTLDDMTKVNLEPLAKWDTQEELEKIIEDHGFAVLHTFAGALGMDYLKSVVEPIKQLAPISSLKGLIDDYDHRTEKVLLLEGETHLYRKPGSLRFSSIPARNNFADLVLHGMVHIPPIEQLAQRIAQRMLKLNNGRMWMAGHMRRGDFVRLSWAMENTVEKHIARVKSRLETGAKKIRQIVTDGSHFKVGDIPFVKPDQTFLGKEPPHDGDKFYIATDERDPAGLEYIRSQGGVLIADLLHPEDRRLVGWPLLYTDVLALVEQSIMAQAAYFYAHAMSSVAGGVVNQRGARGMDPRLTLID